MVRTKPFYPLLFLPLLLFSFLHDKMSSTISTVVGAVGSWLGGWSATLFAIIIAPPLEQVRDRLFPPPPLVTTDDLADLRLSVDLLGGQMELLRESITGIERTVANKIDLQVVLRS